MRKMRSKRESKEFGKFMFSANLNKRKIHALERGREGERPALSLSLSLARAFERERERERFAEPCALCPPKNSIQALRERRCVRFALVVAAVERIRGREYGAPRL